MDLEQAQALYREVVREKGSDFAELTRIGNGDYVVVIQARGRAHWLWTPDDWPKWLNGRTCVQCGVRSEFCKQCVKCKHQFCSADRRLISGQVMCVRCVPAAQIVNLSEVKVRKASVRD